MYLPHQKRITTMLWIIIAAAAAGLGSAGVGIAIRKLSGNRIGKWIIPASAGLGVLLYQISFDYSWYDNQLLHQPEGSLIVATENQPSFLRPWTYFFPLTTAYTLLDPQEIVYQEQADPYAKLARFYLYRIEKAPTEVLKYKQHLLNCTTAELVQLDNKQNMDTRVKVRKLSSQDKLFSTVCD